MKQDIKKIAIVRLSALGDIVNTTVILQFIHNKYKNIKIDWITEEVFAPILKNHPLINEVHTINLKKIKKEKNFSLLKETFSKLRKLDEYDLIIDMQGLLKSAIVSRIIGKNIHGYDKSSAREGIASLFYKTFSHVDYAQNIIKRNTFLASDALGFEISDDMILSKTPLFPHIEKQNKSDTLKKIGIVIGASWKSKKYPKELVVKLCDELKEDAVIIWGNEAEKQEATWICENSSYAKLAPKCSLDELVKLITDFDLVIGNDTGPTHIAWAQNIPSITLFGPTTTRMIYETPINFGIKSPSEVNIFKINKNDFSIKEIKPQQILQKAKELLNNAI